MHASDDKTVQEIIHWAMVRRVICRRRKASYDSNHLADEPAGGTFYHKELQLVRVEQINVYSVEHVLVKRKRGFFLNI